MSIRARKYSVAWLGMVAMSLIVFAPLANQLLKLAESSEPVAVNCSAVKSESARQHTLADSVSACDYCDLVAQQAIAITSVTALEVAAILLATVLTRVPVSPADDPSDRASQSMDPESSRKCSTPLQNQC
jgi:hypothetical protein